MSNNNNGTGFWVIAGLVVVLIPVTLIELAIGCLCGISISFGRRARAR